jgi:hypothetical protein
MPITQLPVVHYPIGLLDVGDSFFIPTLHASAHIHKIRKLADEYEFQIDYRMGIDEGTGFYGMRVIRIA